MNQILIRTLNQVHWKKGLHFSLTSHCCHTTVPTVHFVLTQLLPCMTTLKTLIATPYQCGFCKHRFQSPIPTFFFTLQLDSILRVFMQLLMLCVIYQGLGYTRGMDRVPLSIQTYECHKSTWHGFNQPHHQATFFLPHGLG